MILVELWKESLKSDDQQFHKYQHNPNLRTYISLSSEARRTLRIALMQCNFDYSCSSWYASVSQAVKSELQRKQNNTIRFIKIISSITSIKQTELSSLGFLNLENRMEQILLNNAHTIFNNTYPSYSEINFYEKSKRTNELHNEVYSKNSSCTLNLTSTLFWSKTQYKIKSSKLRYV